MGDTVDNIPGVKGIGEKTAGTLIQQFKNLENLYDHLDDIEQMKLRGAVRIRQTLEAGKDQASLSHALATVTRDVPIDVGLPELQFTGFNLNESALCSPNWNLPTSLSSSKTAAERRRRRGLDGLHLARADTRFIINQANTRRR